MSDLVVYSQAEALQLNAARPFVHPVESYLAEQTPSGRNSLRGALRFAFRTINADYMDLTIWYALDYKFLKAWREKLEQTQKAPATINHALYAIRGVMKEARKLGQVSREACASVFDVSLLKASSDVLRGREIRGAEALQLSEALNDATAGGIRDRAILALLWSAGLRRAEIGALQLTSYNSAEAVLVVDGKGRKRRTIALNDATVHALRAWLEIRGNIAGALFVSITKSGRLQLDAGAMSAQSVYNIVRKYQQRANLQACTPHDFRRSCAGNLLEAGVDISTVAEILGHASVNTTLRYDRRSLERKRRAASLISSPF